MDYEQKYKEALKMAKVAALNGHQNLMEGIFPELAEREDERIRKCLITIIKIQKEGSFGLECNHGASWNEMLSWLEKQCKCETDCHSNHQDANHPNGCITLEDFNDGEGFYKVHLDYLNKKQVEEIEEMVRTWNKELKVPNENIKACIGMCLTDAYEQRFKDYNTNLKDCLAWLEKQGQKSTWSEEDDSMFQSCIGAVATNDYYKGEEKEQIYDWLKTLKQRIGG